MNKKPPYCTHLNCLGECRRDEKENRELQHCGTCQQMTNHALTCLKCKNSGKTMYQAGGEDMFNEISQALIEKGVAMIKFKDEFNKTGLAFNLNSTSIEEAKEVVENKKP